MSQSITHALPFPFLRRYIEKDIGNSENMAILISALDDPSSCRKSAHLYFEELDAYFDEEHNVDRSCAIDNFQESWEELTEFLNISPWVFDPDSGEYNLETF